MDWNYSCRRTAELISQSLDKPLDFGDSILLKVHLAMCGDCSNVKRQLMEIHLLSNAMLAFGDAEPGESARGSGKV